MMASMLIAGAQFRGSSAPLGGAISAVQSSLILSGATISKCTAQQFGGRLAVREAAVIMENTTFHTTQLASMVVAWRCLEIHLFI